MGNCYEGQKEEFEMEKLKSVSLVEENTGAKAERERLLIDSLKNVDVTYLRELHEKCKKMVSEEEEIEVYLENR